jgi:hypothetical protein
VSARKVEAPKADKSSTDKKPSTRTGATAPRSASSFDGTGKGDAAGADDDKVEREPIPLPPPGTAPGETWTDYFAGHRPSAARIREATLKLHERKDHEQVIALIEAALVSGHAQPWMYEVLALTMEVAGRPREDVERVLLSNVDFSALNISNTLYSAAMLTRFGRTARALELYRQAADLDRTRAEPYVLALKLADEAGSAADITWAAAGVLAYVWTPDWEQRHRDAESLAKTWEAKLRGEKRIKEADELAARVAAARVRDLDVELSWSGAGDLDLFVEEPRGGECGFDRRRSAGGGIFVHDGLGPDQKNTWERYVCPRGFSGDYRIKVRHASGEIVGKRAVLKITRQTAGQPPVVERIPIPLDARERTVRLTLTNGRLTEPAPLPAADAKPAEKQGRLDQWKRDVVAARQQRVLGQVLGGAGGAGGGGQAAGGGAGGIGAGSFGSILSTGAAYQPVVTVLSEGVTLSAQALVSADRRYVRLTLAPAFTALTDVMTFSFFSSGASGGGTANSNGAGNRQ